MESIWTATETLPALPSLEKDVQTDVLVIGGGLTGLLCAHFLTAAGLDAVVVEADRLMSGASGFTTAKLTSQHGLIYTKLVKQFDRETATRYYYVNQRAIGEYEKLDIPCDFRRKDAFVYTLGDPEAVEAEQRLVKSLGGDATLEQKIDIPVQAAAAIRFSNQAQFHPIKLAKGLVKNLQIYENSLVTNLKGATAETEHGIIRAKYVIVAAHFPFIDRRGLYFMKLYQQRSYVLGLNIGEELPGMYLDAAENGLSFRSVGDILLLGGGGHRTGKQGGGWEFLLQAAEKLYPGAPLCYRWAAQDCMTLDNMPYVGPYSPGMPGVYVATGFGKWGMTSAMAAAQILTDLILGKRETSLFSPRRRMLRPQLALNLMETTGNILRPTVPRCTHLGCALRWNSSEKSWDCPCHGSRFDETGQVLENPAIRPLQ